MYGVAFHCSNCDKDYEHSRQRLPSGTAFRYANDPSLTVKAFKCVFCSAKEARITNVRALESSEY